MCRPSKICTSKPLLRIIDRHYINREMNRLSSQSGLFPGVEDRGIRSLIKRALSGLESLTPTITVFCKNWIYLCIGANIIHDLLLEKIFCSLIWTLVVLASLNSQYCFLSKLNSGFFSFQTLLTRPGVLSAPRYDLGAGRNDVHICRQTSHDDITSFLYANISFTSYQTRHLNRT